MLRVLHTADWHLGHVMHTRGREFEHARFLAWLLDVLERERVDAMLLCGDVFETIHPPSTAQAAFYGFLAEVRRKCPRLDMVVIGGNHDSAARLEVAAPVLVAMGVHVVGGITRHPGGALDVDRLCVPLHDADGGVAAWCGAVPYLRPPDLRWDGVEEGADRLIEGVRAVYAEVTESLRARAEHGVATIATGHGYLVGCELSMLSERRVLGGNQHALPVDVFADDLGYVALGHLHKAQRVGGRENVRYCGSPIPLSVAERDYAHQVLIADFEGAACREIRELRVPRQVEFLRLPRHGAQSIDELAATVDVLPAFDAMPAGDARPFLEVQVRLDAPEPELRFRVHELLGERSAWLAKIGVEYTGTGRSLAETEAPDSNLEDLEPEAVFRSAWERAHADEPDPAILAEFDALLELVRGGGIG